jgi:hypothetical protein
MSEHSPNDGLPLPGLDGTNPLGFMAALGVIRVLSIQNPSVKLSWKLSRGTWRPTLYGHSGLLDTLGAELHSTIQSFDQSVWSIDKELPFLASRLREHAISAVTNSHRTNRTAADTLAALGTECFREKKKVKKEEIEVFRDTSLRLIRSGDNQHNGLMSYAVRTLLCTSEQIQTAIASNWLYRDEKFSFRWDPAEDRGYALQWGDPSDDGALTERGANCLALFGMACFPVIPVRGQVETTGFGLKEPKQASLTWPIWKHPINLSAVGSLLTFSELQRGQPDRLELDSLGVAAAYRCNRVMTSTYYANFTPAHRVA